MGSSVEAQGQPGAREPGSQWSGGVMTGPVSLAPASAPTSRTSVPASIVAGNGFATGSVQAPKANKINNRLFFIIKPLILSSLYFLLPSIF